MQAGNAAFEVCSAVQFSAVCTNLCRFCRVERRLSLKVDLLQSQERGLPKDGAMAAESDYYGGEKAAHNPHTSPSVAYIQPAPAREKKKKKLSVPVLHRFRFAFS